MGVAYQGVVLNSMTYRPQVTPEALLGRVDTAGRMLSFGVGWTGGALGASALAGLIGLRPALVVVVSIGLVASVFGWLSPLRTIDAPRSGGGGGVRSLLAGLGRVLGVQVALRARRRLVAQGVAGAARAADRRGPGQHLDRRPDPAGQ